MIIIQSKSLLKTSAKLMLCLSNLKRDVKSLNLFSPISVLFFTNWCYWLVSDLIRFSNNTC